MGGKHSRSDITWRNGMLSVEPTDSTKVRNTKIIEWLGYEVTNKYDDDMIFGVGESRSGICGPDINSVIFLGEYPEEINVLLNDIPHMYHIGILFIGANIARIKLHEYEGLVPLSSDATRILRISMVWPKSRRRLATLYRAAVE